MRTAAKAAVKTDQWRIEMILYNGLVLLLIVEVQNTDRDYFGPSVWFEDVKVEVSTYYYVVHACIVCKTN